MGRLRRSLLSVRLRLVALLLAPLGFAVLAGAASAQIAFVQHLGSAANSGTASITINTVSAVTAGNSIIVSIGTNTLSPLSITCSDPVNGPYNTDVSGGGAGAFAVGAICSKHGSAALPADTLITISTDTAEPNSQLLVASANEFSGLAASGALDRTAAATGNSAAPSVSMSQTTSQPAELLVTSFNWSDLDNLTSAGTNGTANPCSNTGTSTYETLPNAFFFPLQVWPLYCIVSTTAQYQGNGTARGSTFWTAVIASYRIASSTPTPTSTPTATPTPSSAPTATPTPTSTPTATPPAAPILSCSNTSTGAWRLVNQGATPGGTGMNRSCAANESLDTWASGSAPEPLMRVCAATSTGTFRAIAAGATPGGSGQNRSCAANGTLYTWPEANGPPPLLHACVNSNSGAVRRIGDTATPQGTGINRACSAGETQRDWPALGGAAS